MNKRNNKKVIIITSILFILVMLILAIKYHKRETNKFNLDQQFLAAESITLPNGSQITTSLASNESKEQHGWIGANLTILTSDIRQHLNYLDQTGIYVQDTMIDSPAQIAGILPGDIITRINNIEIGEVISTLALISQLNPGVSYPFTIYRHGKYLDYSVTINAKQQYL